MEKVIRAIVEMVEIFVLHVEHMTIEWSVNMKGTYTIKYQNEVCGESSEEGLYKVISYYQEQDYTLMVKDGYVRMKKEE